MARFPKSCRDPARSYLYPAAAAGGVWQGGGGGRGRGGGCTEKTKDGSGLEGGERSGKEMKYKERIG